MSDENNQDHTSGKVSGNTPDTVSGERPHVASDLSSEPVGAVDQQSIFQEALPASEQPSSGKDNVASFEQLKRAREKLLKAKSKQNTPDSHRRAAEKLGDMRHRLLEAKGKAPQRPEQPAGETRQRLHTPLPAEIHVPTSEIAWSMARALLKILGLAFYVILLLSIYRMLLAYKASDHFIYAPADMLSGIRFLGISIPHVVIEYQSFQLSAPIILIFMQIASPFVTLASIPLYKDQFWSRFSPSISIRNLSTRGKIVRIFVVWPWLALYFGLRALWQLTMIALFVAPVPLLMLTALEFLPNATVTTVQLNDIASFALLTAMFLGLFVSVYQRKTKQIATIFSLVLLLTLPYIPIWHSTYGPKARTELNPLLLSLETGLCRILSYGAAPVTTPEGDTVDNCVPISGFSPADDYFFGYPVAAELGLPLSYFDSFTLNADLIEAVEKQTDQPLSFFTVSRNFFMIRSNEIDLSNVDFRGSSFVVRDFQNAKLSGAQFGCPSELVDGIDFNLHGCTDLNQADFRGASLEDSTFERVHLQEANFSSAKMMRSTFSQVNMNSSVLIEADLSDSNFYWVGMVETNMNEARLRGASFDKVDFSDSIMHNIMAEDSRFANVTLSGADLSESNLSGSSMRNVNLDATLLLGADLSRSYIGDSSFVETLMTDTKMDQTVIKNNNSADTN